MVVVAIIAIVSAIAAPNITSTLQSQRNKSTAQSVFLVLKEARAESLLRRQDINVTVANTSVSAIGSGSSATTGSVPVVLRHYDVNANAPISGGTTTFYANKTAVAKDFVTYCDADKAKIGRTVSVDVNGNITIKTRGSQC